MSSSSDNDFFTASPSSLSSPNSLPSSPLPSSSRSPTLLPSPPLATSPPLVSPAPIPLPPAPSCRRQFLNIVKRIYQSLWADISLVLIITVISGIHVIATLLLNLGGISIARLGSKHMFHAGESKGDIVALAAWGLISAIFLALFIVYSNRPLGNWGWKEYVRLAGDVAIVLIRIYVVIDTLHLCARKHKCERSKVLSALDLTIVPMVMGDISVYTIGRVRDRRRERRERRLLL